MSHLQLGYRTEYEWLGPGPDERPTVVMLHHGLGSVSAWRDFPQWVADTTRLGVLVYSRRGNGTSDPVTEIPRPVDFMHREALDHLPRLLRTLDVRSPILLGQSDGASIAIIYAAAHLAPHPIGLILLAPHVFVEDCTVESAREALRDFETDDLRERMARRHADPDGAFHGWNATWLRPEFRAWNIEDEVSRIHCPVTVVQGLDDEYGTEEQIRRIERRLHHTPDVVVLPDCRHSPQRDQPEATLKAIHRHVQAVVGHGDSW